MSRIRLVLFDMDGVLVDTPSSWVTVHRYFGVDNEENLRRFWNGEIDELEFVRSDVRLWKSVKPDVTLTDIEHILSSVKIMDGAAETVSALRRLGIKTAIVSGGIDILAGRVASTLGMDYSTANGLCADGDGRLTGEGILRVRISNKAESASGIMRSMGIQADEALAVGDSITDIPLFDLCAAGVAFNTDDARVLRKADYVIDNLYSIVELVERLNDGG